MESLLNSEVNGLKEGSQPQNSHYLSRVIKPALNALSKKKSEPKWTRYKISTESSALSKTHYFASKISLYGTFKNCK